MTKSLDPQQEDIQSDRTWKIMDWQKKNSDWLILVIAPLSIYPTVYFNK